MDQSRKVTKPARGQLNREIKCPCRCIRGKYIYIYICTAVCIYLFVDIPGIFFIWGHVHSFVHGSLLYMDICVTTAVCMYVRPSHLARVRINRVRFAILLVMS